MNRRRPQSSKLVEVALEEAAPYLENAEWLRAFIKAQLHKHGAVRLEEALLEVTVGRLPPTQQTDLKIFLTYLGKVRRRRGESRL